MPRSNFPNGFLNGVTIRGVPILNMYNREVYWIDENAAHNGLKGTFDKPFNSFEDALNYAKLQTSDMIICKAGHTESVASAGAIDFDTAGIAVIGMGHGAQRPTLTFATATTADIDIDANDITFFNLLFVTGVDNLTAPIDVNSADFALINCETRDNDSNYHCDDFIKATSAATRLLIDGWLHRARGGKTGPISALHVDGADDIVVRNFNVVGDFSAGAIDNATGTDEWLGATIEHGLIHNENSGPAPGLALDANSTGTAYKVQIRIESGNTYVTANNDMQFVECYGMNTDASGWEPVATAITGGLEGKIDTVDGYHDVPTADTSDNAQMRDVIGNKDDAAAAAAVTTAESLMAYVKQVVGNVVGSAVHKSHDNYITVTADMTSATWNALAAHEIATVTGLCRLRILAETVSNIGNDSNTATMALGDANNTTDFIAATTATQLDAGEIWWSSTGSDNKTGVDFDNAVIDVVVNGADVGYTIGTTATTAGSMTFHIWWEPLETGASVAAGAGGTFA